MHDKFKRLVKAAILNPLGWYFVSIVRFMAAALKVGDGNATGVIFELVMASLFLAWGYKLRAVEEAEIFDEITKGCIADEVKQGVKDVRL